MNAAAGLQWLLIDHLCVRRAKKMAYAKNTNTRI